MSNQHVSAITVITFTHELAYEEKLPQKEQGQN